MSIFFKKNKVSTSSSDNFEVLWRKMKGDPIENKQHSGIFTKDNIEVNYYNEDTLHGVHYTEEAFYAEAKRRYHNFCNSFPHLADNIKEEIFVINTFEDWSDPTDERMKQFLEKYQLSKNEKRF